MSLLHAANHTLLPTWRCTCVAGDVGAGLRCGRRRCAADAVVDRIVRTELIGQQVAVEVDHTGSAVVQ